MIHNRQRGDDARGHYYEQAIASVETQSYWAGTSRIAMNQGGTVYYLLSDQLGSTSVTTNASGTKVSELRYKAWGEIRYTYQTTPTRYTYTGQYSNVADFGLMYYNARWPQGPYHRALRTGRQHRAGRRAGV